MNQTKLCRLCRKQIDNGTVSKWWRVVVVVVVCVGVCVGVGFGSVWGGGFDATVR